MKLGSVLSEDDRKTRQGYINIRNQTAEQLDELIQRQNKLLQNKSFLERLPDKGEKILSFKHQLEAEYRKRQQECDAACQLLSNLTLTDKNAEEIEWNSGESNTNHRQLDSDDDDDDSTDDLENDKVNPLRCIATHSGTASGKIVKINSTKSENTNKDFNGLNKTLYVDKYCERFEKLNCSKERFKPNRLRNPDKSVYVTSAEKVKERLGNKWEVTEATPPAPVYKDAVMISLNESLKLQREQAEKLKEIEKKSAVEKLLQNLSVKMGDKLPVSNINEYRTSKNEIDDTVDNDEINEFSDCEDGGNSSTEYDDCES